MFTIDDAIRRRQTGPANPDGSSMVDEQPEWGGVQFGAPGDPAVLTAGQLDQDAQARAGIESRNAAQMTAIDNAEKERGDPMARAIDARKQTAAYEDLAPAGDTSHIGAQGPNLPPEGIYEEQPIGGRTSGQMNRFDEAIVKQRVENEGKALGRTPGPREVSEGQAANMRVASVLKLFKLRRDLDQDVLDHKRSQMNADDEYNRQEREIAKLVAMLKPAAEGHVNISAGLAEQAGEQADQQGVAP